MEKNKFDLWSPLQDRLRKTIGRSKIWHKSYWVWARMRNQKDVIKLTCIYPFVYYIILVQFLEVNNNNNILMYSGEFLEVNKS